MPVARITVLAAMWCSPSSTIVWTVSAVCGARLQPIDHARNHQLGAEPQRLTPGPVAQLVTAQAIGKAEIVLDPGRRTRLAAQGVALEQHRPEPLGRAVDRGRQSGGSASHNRHVVGLVLGLDLKAERLGQAAHSGVLQPSAVGEEDGERDGSIPRLLPGERNPIPGEESAQIGTGRVLGVPDDRGRHGRVLDPELADAIHPSR